jgi:uncharacterized protein (TIRG00374 family)
VNLTIGAITLAFSYLALRQVNFGEAWHAARSSDYLWLVPALAAFGAGNIARALRWRSLFAPGRRPPPGPMLNATMLGYFYNSILPARAGEAARVLVLTQRSTAPAVEVVGTVVIERLYDLMAILIIFFVAAAWLPHVTWLKAAAFVAIVLAALIASAATALAVFGERPVRVLLKPLAKLSLVSELRLERAVHELAHGLSGLRQKAVALEGFAWTLLAWMLSALCAYFVILAFRPHLPFLCGVLVVVAVGLAMIVPAPPAAIGVFEGAALVALKVYGVPYSSALPYALVLHLVNVVPFLLFGVLLLQHNARHPVGELGTTDLPLPVAS